MSRYPDRDEVTSFPVVTGPKPKERSVPLPPVFELPGDAAAVAPPLTPAAPSDRDHPRLDRVKDEVTSFPIVEGPKPKERSVPLPAVFGVQRQATTEGETRATPAASPARVELPRGGEDAPASAEPIFLLRDAGPSPGVPRWIKAIVGPLLRRFR
jgi:hypothetical protein